MGLPAGIYLAVAEPGGLVAINIDGTPLGFFALGEIGIPAISPDLTTLAYDTTGGHFAFLHLDTGAEILFEPYDMTRGRPSWSPWPHLLAVNGVNMNEAIQPHVGIIDMVEMSYTRLVDWAEGQHSPSWSPDGHWIAFTSDMAREDLTRDLYLLDTSCLSSLSSCAGSIEGPLLAGTAFDYSSPSWSPDSRLLAFGCGQFDGQNEIERVCIMDLASRSIVRMLDTDQDTAYVYPSSWSPDGRWLAVVDPYPGRTGLMDPDTGELTWIIDRPFVFWVDRRTPGR